MMLPHAIWHLLALFEPETSLGTSPSSIIHWAADGVLLIGNVLLYVFRGRRDDIDKTETERLNAVDGLLKARSEELLEIRALKAKLESEYKAIVGLDLQLLIEFGREGIMARMANLERLLRIKNLDTISPQANEDSK